MISIRTTPIPQTADAFKAWAERECGKWPAKLQAKAYATWRSMEDLLDSSANVELATFTEQYRQWEASQS